MGDEISHAKPNNDRTNNSYQRSMPLSPWRIIPNRTTALRVLLICCLAIAVTLCFSLSYTFLRNSEQSIGLQTYESVATMALAGAEGITMRRVQSARVMAVLMGEALPNREDWPFIRFNGYMPIAANVATLSHSGPQTVMVVLEPSQVADFERHTQQFYSNEGRPEKAGFSDFGFGIWKPDPNSTHADRRTHDTTGETTWGGRNRILTPLMLHNVPIERNLLFNLYASKDRGPHIDSMIDCVNRHRAANKTGSPECPVVTDILEIVTRPGPAAVVFQPIFPANDPSHFVGFATTSLHWEEILDRVVPNFVSGLTCVIQTETKSYTYEIQNGHPVLIGAGDLHDRKYSHLGKGILLNDFPTDTSSCAKYTLTVYPTTGLIETFSTSSPLFVALGFLAVISAVAFVFFMYDYFMRHEAQQRKAVLDMKRKFVRFISHEIRTPLNTVCMGLELLESELHTVVGNQHNDSKFTGSYVEDEKDVPFWYDVTIDVKENAAVAVSILNDLLNYDKIETNTLNLELGKVNIQHLLEKTVNQFRIQAVNAKIDLLLNMRNILSSDQVKDLENGYGENNCEQPLSECSDVAIYGDYVKLGQVIRNLVSNALKFTPASGTIEVTALYQRIDLTTTTTITKSLKASNANIFPITSSYPLAGLMIINVRDTGIGLTKDQLQLLFAEGVQFDANRLQHGGGSGLGLNIAHGIVRQHGGSLRAASDGPNKGCTFTIELPLHRFDENLQPDLPATSTVAMAESVSTQSCMEKAMHRRLLVVEDSESSRKMLIRLLERAGHECLAASNGEEAVDAIRFDMTAYNDDATHTPVDTILMDYEMPILKGPSAARAIRDLGYKGIIIGVTGNILSEDVINFKENGADDVLAKPISMARIQTYWNQHRHKLSAT